MIINLCYQILSSKYYDMLIKKNCLFVINSEFTIIADNY